MQHLCQVSSDVDDNQESIDEHSRQGVLTKQWSICDTTKVDGS